MQAKQLQELIARQQPVSLFSEALCANYFTYTHGAEHRFVLYDTEESILKKLRFAAQLGCGSAFLLYTEAEALPSFLRRIKKEKIL